MVGDGPRLAGEPVRSISLVRIHFHNCGLPVRGANQMNKSWKVRRFALQQPQRIVVVIAGLEHMFEGKYTPRDTLKTLSQEGNVAHARWKNARRIALFAGRDA